MECISKSEERAARVRFEITSMISDQNCTTPSSITTLLQPFWNRRIQSVPIFYQASEDIASQSWKNLQICMVGEGGGGGEGGEGQVCAPHHTNVCKISPLWGFMSSLIFNKSLSNLALLLILGRSFQWCGRIVVNLSMSKVEKNREKVSTQFLQILLVTAVYVKREAWPFLISFNRQ